MISRLIRFCLEQRLVVVLITLMVVGFGLRVAPFNWDLGGWPRNPVPVDAIPDIGENQQIVFTEWAGRSPQDVEDQVTYPLTVALLGLPGVKTIRSSSFFGFSNVYVIFDEGVEFYWSRSRVLEKLASLPGGTLPEGVAPTLGPDATPLGQVYWYTLEGRDPQGRPTEGWDLHELRSVQDWQVRYALLSAGGVSEVASVGGYVREYQVDVDPDAMRAHRVSLAQVLAAVKGSNLEVGARVLEINRAEYFVRGTGWVEDASDIEESVITAREGVPIRVRDVAQVGLGPAMRRGALDKGGSQAVGGVVVVRYGSNPLEVIENVKARVAEIAPGLPRKVLPDGTVSQLTVVPFYDRAGLIHETLDTLADALTDEVLITVLVVVFLVGHLRASLLIAALLPIAMLFAFGCMKLFRVDANIVALSGIAIAIGTMVDMGIVLVENILSRLDEAPDDEPPIETVWRAASEVGSAVLTAVATTVVGFLPVFAMTGAEGKLFGPLAYTKTFALIGAVVVAVVLIPPFALTLLVPRWRKRRAARPASTPGKGSRSLRWMLQAAVILAVAVLLADHWEPLGAARGRSTNLIFVLLVSVGLLTGFSLLTRAYGPILRWCLTHRILFLSLPASAIVLGACVWLGFGRVFAPLPAALESMGVDASPLKSHAWWVAAEHQLPGLGKEFMPPLDEGSWLFMPTTMPHASMGEALDVLSTLDRALETVPEVAQAVGKIGRAESPLDPAPISMVETVVHMHPEYRLDAQGRRELFRWDDERDSFALDANDRPIPDDDGRPWRNWRDHIRTADDVWDEIVSASRLLGTTSAPRLQPIAARIVMLQSGMRAPMGVKIKGPDLATIEQVGLAIEDLLREVPGVQPASVIADRVVGKPYLEIDIDRAEAARYGVSLADVQAVIEVALGGKRVTATVEGRERYPVRVRYLRELRDNLDSMVQVLVPTPSGAQVPLGQLASVRYARGPQMIRTEDTFLTSYVLFDKLKGEAEVDVVERSAAHLQRALDSGLLELPSGVSFSFAGSYENQVRASSTLAVVMPLALLLILLILYLQFREVTMSLLVFSGVFVSWAGGFLLIWLYAQPWFLDWAPFGTDLRTLFQVSPMLLSVAVWVGFLALFGIATDDGVVVATYLQQSFRERRPTNRDEVHAAVMEAGLRRVRPCVMTTATTLLALLPVLTSTGRGADIMIPMAIPSVGGMIFELMLMFLVPVLVSIVEERRLRRAQAA